ncbi:hypothetical protein [Caballeronia sp. BR00000012568055]|nr:hypothetical protein [Caballeronia sp. BR00000012568055]
MDFHEHARIRTSKRAILSAWAQYVIAIDDDGSHTFADALASSGYFP